MRILLAANSIFCFTWTNEISSTSSLNCGDFVTTRLDVYIVTKSARGLGSVKISEAGYLEQLARVRKVI